MYGTYVSVGIVASFTQSAFESFLKLRFKDIRYRSDVTVADSSRNETHFEAPFVYCHDFGATIC